MRTLQKQYSRSITALERACVRSAFPLASLSIIRELTSITDDSQKEQIKSIEQTKLTLKKRKGVVPFVRVFPVRLSPFPFARSHSLLPHFHSSSSAA